MKEVVLYLSLIICVVGGLLFLVLKSPGQADYKALAKDMFWVGLLAFLLSK
jgi:hypothetical protein